MRSQQDGQLYAARVAFDVGLRAQLIASGFARIALVRSYRKHVALRVEHGYGCWLSVRNGSAMKNGRLLQQQITKENRCEETTSAWYWLRSII